MYIALGMNYPDVAHTRAREVKSEPKLLHQIVEREKEARSSKDMTFVGRLLL
jgi:hypothetical protein